MHEASADAYRRDRLGNTAIGNLCRPGAAENDPSQISREEWQARVKASQQRADMMRREHRALAPQPRRPEDMDEEASRRILEDGSLAPGDIVSTRQGLFEFRGASDRERKPDDFVRIR